MMIIARYYIKGDQEGNLYREEFANDKDLHEFLNSLNFS